LAFGGGDGGEGGKGGIGVGGGVVSGQPPKHRSPIHVNHTDGSASAFGDDGGGGGVGSGVAGLASGLEVCCSGQQPPRTAFPPPHGRKDCVPRSMYMAPPGPGDHVGFPDVGRHHSRRAEVFDRMFPTDPDCAKGLGVEGVCGGEEAGGVVHGGPQPSWRY
jgi:hypothetical protein